MAEIDYGYGEQDYGYGEAEPDMGYGVAEPDMGYGEAAPDMGYGDAAPDEYNAPYRDYAAEEQTDYGYGDGDAEPVQAPPEDRRPKRRCSVTKFSLATETPLTAASVINDLRMGLAISPSEQQGANENQPNDIDDTHSTVRDHSPAGGKAMAAAQPEQPKDKKKGGVIGRIRRRLSIAM